MGDGGKWGRGEEEGGGWEKREGERVEEKEWWKKEEKNWLSCSFAFRAIVTLLFNYTVFK